MAATTFDAGDGSGRMLAPVMARADLLPNLRGIFDVLAGERMLEEQTSFGSLDPDVLNESIPAFFIGRNADGFWVARERRGRIGGIFLLKRSAVSFAHRHAGDAACATVFPADGFELDIENNGNQLVGLIRPLVSSVARLCRQISKRMQAGQAA